MMVNYELISNRMFDFVIRLRSDNKPTMKSVINSNGELPLSKNKFTKEICTFGDGQAVMHGQWQNNTIKTGPRHSLIAVPCYVATEASPIPKKTRTDIFLIILGKGRTDEGELQAWIK